MLSNEILTLCSAKRAAKSATIRPIPSPLVDVFVPSMLATMDLPSPSPLGSWMAKLSIAGAVSFVFVSDATLKRLCPEALVVGVARIALIVVGWPIKNLLPLSSYWLLWGLKVWYATSPTRALGSWCKQ